MASWGRIVSDPRRGQIGPRFGPSAFFGQHPLTRRRLLFSSAAATGLAIGAANAVAASSGGSGTRSLDRRQDAPRSGGSLQIGLQSEPDSLDPHVTPYAVSHNVMMNVFDTLVWQDPVDGSFKPGLATSWEASLDGLSYRFNLRLGVTFHDGTPCDATAVKFTFDRIVDPATKSGYAASLLGPYAGSEVVDQSTLQVHFTEPYAPLLDSLSQAFLGIVSPAAIAQLGNDAFGQQPVGTGPFVFKEWTSDDHITLVRN